MMGSEEFRAIERTQHSLLASGWAVRTKNLVLDLRVADLGGQLFLRRTGDQQQQAVVQILHSRKMPKALV